VIFAHCIILLEIMSFLFHNCTILGSEQIASTTQIIEQLKTLKIEFFGTEANEE